MNAYAAQKLEDFRAEYRSRFEGKFYSGFLHVTAIYALGATALVLFIGHIHAVKPAEWLVIPVTFMICNIMEWVMHAHTMHRPKKGLLAIYQRHTLNHHNFFSDRNMTFEKGPSDYRIVFFPPFALLGVLLLSAPAVVLLAFVWSLNAGLLFIATTTTMYLIYECFHFCSHLPDSPILRHMPFVNTIRRHHRAHHDKTIMMDRNMNLTFVVADWMFGTSDLNRGLLGHVFNGYDERYLKRDASRARNVSTA